MPNSRASIVVHWNEFWWVAFVGLATFFLCFPFMRSVFWLGDEGVLLHGAERILRGDKLYIDFFEFLPPGGFIVTAAWLDIAGTSMWSTRWLAILTITGIACFTYLASLRASKDALTSALIAIGWVVVSQGVWTQLNHHYFTTLFSMITAWATLSSIEYPKRWMCSPIVAGVFAGAAAMVTPTRGALAMLAGATVFLDVRRYRRELSAYVLACALVPICLVGYVLYQGAFIAAFDDVIVNTAKRYASIQSVPFGHFADEQNLLLTYLFPVAALLTLLICARNWRASLHDRLFQICFAFGLAGLVGCFPRPDIVHIAFAAPLVCPLLAYCINRITRSWPLKYHYAAAAIVIGLGIPSARAYWWTADRVLHTEIVTTPRGAVAFMYDPHGAPALIARIAATPPEESYFFYPYSPMLPFLTAREHVSKYDIFTPGYTLPAQYQEACIGVMRHASWVVMDRGWSDPEFLRKIFPAMRDAAPQETIRFELALERGFEFVAREGAFEMRRRVKTIDESICAGIAE